MTKMMQWWIAVAFIVAGILLLCVTSRAEVKPAFVPTRFAVADEGTVGKPDVVLAPGLTSSREQ